jgi:hypothetical protein
MPIPFTQSDRALSRHLGDGVFPGQQIRLIDGKKREVITRLVITSRGGVLLGKLYKLKPIIASHKFVNRHSYKKQPSNLIEEIAYTRDRVNNEIRQKFIKEFTTVESAISRR